MLIVGTEVWLGGGQGLAERLRESLEATPNPEKNWAIVHDVMMSGKNFRLGVIQEIVILKVQMS